MAARGEGDYSIDSIQRALNLWVPRGLEMFGNEHGGETAVTFGFKDKTNGVAQDEYYEEVRGVIRNVNIAIVQERLAGIAREETRALLDEIERSGDPQKGVKPEEILYLPSKKFFRKRGPEEVVFKPFDYLGNLITENGQPLAPDAFLKYLAGALPEKFIGSREYNKFVAQMREYHSLN